MAAMLKLVHAALRRAIAAPALAPARCNSTFVPSRTKFRKQFKGRVRGYAHSGNTIAFGSYGLQALDPVRITSNQLEAARRAITRKVKKAGQLWVRVFPDVPVTKKPAEVRMGKGKGSVDHYVCRVKANKVLFEMDGVPKELAQDALRLAADKLPVRTRFLDKTDALYPQVVAAMRTAYATSASQEAVARGRAVAAARVSGWAAGAGPATAAAV